MTRKIDPVQAKQERLWKLCRAFIDDQRISCPEAVYQVDSVMENAHEFIGKVCKIVGFAHYPSGDA